MKSPIRRIVPKNLKGRALQDFLNIHSVAKYEKIDGGTLWSNKKISEKMRNLNSLTVPKKRGKSHSVKKTGRGHPSALEWLFISC